MRWQKFIKGVLHNAIIINPDLSKQRIINSTLIAPSSTNQEKEISKNKIDYFINTCEVKQKLYN